MRDDSMKKKENGTNPDASYDFLEEIIKTRPGASRRGHLLLAAALAAAFFVAVCLAGRKRTSDGPEAVPDARSASETIRRSVAEVWTERLHFAAESEDEDEALCGLIIRETDEKLYLLCDGSGRDAGGRVRVSFSKNDAAEADVVGTDPGTGLVVLAVDRSGAPPFAEAAGISEKGAAEGDSVIAIGGPLGYSDSVAEGTIVSCGETAFVVDGAYPLIGTDIRARGPGSGFLIGADGRVLGCVFTGLEEGETLTAVPFPSLRDTIDDLLGGKAVRYAGILGVDVTEEVSLERGVPAGIYVTAALPDSPALLSGLAAGDVITGIGGRDVRTMQELHEILAGAEVGGSLTLRVLRGGADGYVAFQFSMTVGESDEIYQRAS